MRESDAVTGSGGVVKSTAPHRSFYFCQLVFETMSQVKKISDLGKNLD